MKVNLLAKILVGLVLLSSMATAALAYTYVKYMQQIRDLQVQASVANRNRGMFHELATEAVSYSRRNPAMNQILHEVGISKSRPSNNAPAPQPPAP